MPCCFSNSSFGVWAFSLCGSAPKYRIPISGIQPLSELFGINLGKIFARFETGLVDTYLLSNRHSQDGSCELRNKSFVSRSVKLSELTWRAGSCFHVVKAINGDDFNESN